MEREFTGEYDSAGNKIYSTDFIRFTRDTHTDLVVSFTPEAKPLHKRRKIVKYHTRFIYYDEVEKEYFVDQEYMSLREFTRTHTCYVVKGLTANDLPPEVRETYYKHFNRVE